MRTPYALEPCAALEFEPWNLKEAAWSPPSNVEWCQLANPFLVTTRLAWAALGMTKAELMETVARCNTDEVLRADNPLERFAEAAEWFKRFVTVLEAAEARWIVAASALVERDEREAKAE